MKPQAKTLGLGLILLAVFGGSFYFFYKRAQKAQRKPDRILTSAVINQPLPKANLVDASGKPLADERLRQGKVVLVFMMPDCQPCDQENDFLKTVAGSRQDVSFLYVIPFGNKNQVLG